ncbi:hypothetical protein [Nocardioides sp.]|uniref:hypothetical protein n=1 Tax=Nocardioides sp. TaxID=35761 RepID=UPI002722184E|nr:hypothetical protein [Nocardioides sp.]MDO9454681.1 hypothetical protein [Nocardioides sp.]
MNSNELLDYELRRTHTAPAADREARNRATLATTRRQTRRQTRRHRLAERVRSVADRLDV